MNWWGLLGAAMPAIALGYAAMSVPTRPAHNAAGVSFSVAAALVIGGVVWWAMSTPFSQMLRILIVGVVGAFTAVALAEGFRWIKDHRAAASVAAQAASAPSPPGERPKQQPGAPVEPHKPPSSAPQRAAGKQSGTTFKWNSSGGAFVGNVVAGYDHVEGGGPGSISHDNSILSPAEAANPERLRIAERRPLMRFIFGKYQQEHPDLQPAIPPPAYINGELEKAKVPYRIEMVDAQNFRYVEINPPSDPKK